MRFLRTIGQKGTLTLPSEIRQVLDVREGDIVEFEVVSVVQRRDGKKPKSLKREAVSA